MASIFATNNATNSATKSKTDVSYLSKPLNNEGHPTYYVKGSVKAKEAIAWNKNRNYSKDYIKAVQKKVGTNDDGSIGTNTINAIHDYQSKKGITTDGKWGKQCATVSGLTRQYKSVSSTVTTTKTANAQSYTKANDAKNVAKTGAWDTSIKNSDVDSSDIPSQVSVQAGKSKYGAPMTSDCQQRLALPFEMYTAYGKDGLGAGGTVTSIPCHKLVHDRLKAIFQETLDLFGADGVHSRRLDVFSGAYCPKKIGQSGAKNVKNSSWAGLSMHAWGVAIDVDGGNNPNRKDTKNVDWLNMNSAKGKEHGIAKFWDIVAKHGGYSLGKNNNKDWMHIQFAKIN